MLSKTYKEQDYLDGELFEREQVARPKRKKPQRKIPSKKELLDSIEEHNDGYIPTEVDDLARDE